MQIKHVEGKVRLVFDDTHHADLTVQQALQLRPELGPAVRVGGKPTPTDYLKLAIDEAIAYGNESRQKEIARLREEIRKLEAGECTSVTRG